jgi:hypothetical protein
MNCNQCGTEIPAGSTFCTKCGTRVTVEGAAAQPTPTPPPPAGYAAMPPPPPPPAYAPMPPSAQPMAAPYGAQKRTSGLAIGALIAGIASFLFDWVLFIPSLAAVVLGIIAISQIGKNPAMGGKSMAIIGLILGIIGGLLWIMIGGLIACLPWGDYMYGY